MPGCRIASVPPLPKTLSERQRRHLRGLAHELQPVVRLGNAGLTDAVARETDRALTDHELIKIKAPGGAGRPAMRSSSSWPSAPAARSCTGSATWRSSTGRGRSCRG